jgi:hypothetical protein
VSTEQTEGMAAVTSDKVSVDVALRDALLADGTSALRESVLDLAAAAWRLSCSTEGEEAASIRRLAETLKDAVRVDAPAAGPPPAAAPASQVTPDGPGSVVRTGTAARLPPWLAETCERVRALSGGRLNPARPDPAGLWLQLHLGSLWLPDSQRRQAAELLGGPEEYLVPPLPEAGVAGITWSQAQAHPAVEKALADWPAEARVAGERLAPLIGLTLTVADQADGLYTTGGPLGREVTPVRTRGDRQSFRERTMTVLARIGSAGQDPYQRVDWLSELDEVLRSLFPLPTPSPYGLWAKRLADSRDLLAEHALALSPEAEIVLVKADTSYEDIARRTYAPDNNLAVAPFQPSDLNTVLWPLRAYVMVPGMPPGGGRLLRPGRVIYGHDNGVRLAVPTDPS